MVPAPGDTDAWDARREKLGAKLAEHRARNASQAQKERSPGTTQGIAEGLKLASEFVAGIIVGAAIGYGIDQLAGTMPFGLIVFLMIGFAAGVKNVLSSVSPKPSPLAKAPPVTKDASRDNGENR
ncbi:AtpZ/AtpI family protein [Jiella sp. KSK16Y-1]|uniref:AtpZ/AtpI family protein n=2 Tax=Jiella mangrovi TaxID=2821407 RepID=A0ABS4BLX8_9HYPH|nr:AtpZ/AtpI family protein [Jiella mangrovi]MBP0617226.1 AtpZ/AtpI family protein [Jiella mangrovi]